MQRVALITGGMGGLGEAVCIKLAALGVKIDELTPEQRRYLNLE